jgi:hypothetical protein
LNDEVLIQMATEIDTLAEVIGAIRDYIEGKFAEGRSRVYLSSVGSDLPDLKTQSETLTGLRFAQFIEKNLGYPIGRTGAHNNVLYVARKEGQAADLGAVSVPRFISSFWAAFSKFIAEGEQRYINLSNLQFGPDRVTVGSDTDDVRQIESQFVATNENERHPAAMLTRIDCWLEQQGLERQRFLGASRKQSTHRRSLLAKVVSELSPDQLKRTSLPLDVVKALLDQDG